MEGGLICLTLEQDSFAGLCTTYTTAIVFRGMLCILLARTKTEIYGSAQRMEALVSLIRRLRYSVIICMMTWIIPVLAAIPFILHTEIEKGICGWALLQEA